MNEKPFEQRRRWLQVREWFLLVALVVACLGWWHNRVKVLSLEAEVDRQAKALQASDSDIFALLAERDAVIARLFQNTENPDIERAMLESVHLAIGAGSEIQKAWDAFLIQYKSQTAQ
jgi:hypothetical protein